VRPNSPQTDRLSQQSDFLTKPTLPEASKIMNGRHRSLSSFMNLESAKKAERDGQEAHYVALLFAAVVVGCFWAASPCDAQIEANAYISSNGSNNVSVIDTETNTLVGSAIPVGTNPFGVATTPDGRFAYVADVGSNTVSVINAATNQLSSTIPVGTAPFGVAVTPDAKFAYVANNGTNSVSVISTATNQVVGTISVGTGPFGVAVTPDGRFAYVANNTSDNVSVINTATNQVVAIVPVGLQPQGIAVTPNGQFAYVTNHASNTVSVISTANNTLFAVVPVPSAGMDVVSPDGNFVYVTNEMDPGTVSVISTASNTVVATEPALPSPFGVALTPDGKFLYVPDRHDNEVSVINTTTNTVVASVPVNTPLVFGSFVGPNVIVPQGGPLSIGNDAALTPLGFGTFVDFNGGTLRTTGSLITARTISLLVLGGTIDTNGFNSVFSGDIINSGSLTKTGAGTLTLSGTNTYTGGTTVLAGTLQAGSAGGFVGNTAYTVNGGTLDLNNFNLTMSSLNGAGGVVNLGSAALTLDNSGSDNYSGIIQGTGSLTKTGAGTQILSGANTYTGGTTVLAGTLQAGSAGGFVGNTAYTVNGGTLDLNNFNLTMSSLNGAGGVVHLGSAALTLDNSGSDNYSGIIQGTGSLTKIGPGTQILSGANTYTGGTTVLAGTLEAGSAGGFVGSTAYTVNGGTLDLNNFNLTMSSLNGAGGVVNLGSAGLTVHNSDTNIYAGIIQGTGSLTKIGAGALILSGDNTYSGGTLLTAGTLVVNNAQALGLGDVVVSGGVLRADPQPINVKGNYTQKAGGTLQLNVGGVAPGEYDFLNVSGHAALDGTLQPLLVNGFQPRIGDKLTVVLAAGGVSGQFANLLDPSSSVIRFELVYLPNSVLLEFGSDFSAFARTPNQLVVASQLDRVAFDPRESQLISFLESEPTSSLASDFDKISPDSLSATYEISFSAANIQAANLENRFAEIRNGSTGFTSSLNVSNSPGTMVESKDGKAMIEPNKNVMTPSPENKWGVWSSGSGQFVDVNGDGNAKGYDFATGGVSFGLDYRLTKNFAVGVAIGYAHTWTNLTGNGSIDVNSGRGGLYATFSQGGFYLNGYAGGAYSSYYAERAALGGSATGSSQGGEFDGYGGCGYEFHCGGFTFGPIASLEYTDVEVRGYNESGSLTPLRIVSQSEDSLRTNLGLSASYTWKIGRVQLKPSVRASWQHEYAYSALPINARFGSGAGSAFTVYGPAEGHDSAVIDAGIDVLWTPTIGTYFGYNGEVGRSNYDSNSVICSVHVDF
jgi:YVTN family beta-propeller protein/autotransporter-associated beta strand protein